MTDIETLRKNYRTVRAWAVGCGEWTEAEADEIGQAIKTAIAEHDAGYLAWWGEWLSTWAEIADLLTTERLYERELKRLRDERAGRMLRNAA